MDPFIGEIRILAANYAPEGWAVCDGQLLPISQNPALYSVLGTTYGGNGTSTFALPDLRGRSPIGVGQGPGLSKVRLGEKLGVDTVALLESEIPSHTHTARAAAFTGTTGNPSAASWAISRSGRASEKLYAPLPSEPVAMAADGIGSAGGGAAHNNLAPYLTLLFVIALQGVFPPRG